MDAPGGFGDGHALHAVDAGLVFQTREGAVALDGEDDFFEAADAGFVLREDFNAPAAFFGVAAVHAEQVARKEGGFIAAGAGADFDDHVAVVARVLGHQQGFELFFEGFGAR